MVTRVAAQRRGMLPAMQGVTRRRFLTAPVLLLGGSTLAACSDRPAPVALDPERERLDAALVLESQLLLDATTWAADDPSRMPVTTVFSTHVERLQQTLTGTTPPSASATDDPATSTELTTDSPTPPTTAGLAEQVRRAVAAHTRALRDADPPVAQLLASIAASDAAVVDSLRRIQ